jgi:hypothetical protein
MCIFSTTVLGVTQTHILIKDWGMGDQTLIYQMRLHSRTPTAMVLPVPVAKQGLFKFISMEQYPEFFTDLEKCFGVRDKSLGSTSRSMKSIEVQEVGQYVASFVETLDDFSRLDPIFRLKPEILSRLPKYKDFSFAVFALKPSANYRKIHPMAFHYSTEFLYELHFPTYHLHDNDLTQVESYDHVLYFQSPRVGDSVYPMWDRNPGSILTHMTQSKVDPYLNTALSVYRREIRGKRANRDMRVELDKGNEILIDPTV